MRKSMREYGDSMRVVWKRFEIKYWRHMGIGMRVYGESVGENKKSTYD